MNELETILNRLSNITLEETATQPIMSQVNYQLLRLHLDSIIPYDGNPHTLGIFLDNCNNFINTFITESDDSLNRFIIRALLGKLTGRALLLVGSRTEFKTWAHIRDALIVSFGDQRNVDCLVQDLLTLRPSKNETSHAFGMRCQDARSLIISRLNTEPLDPLEKQVHIKSYEELSLKTFIRGLPPHLQTIIRLKDPNSLEKAMSLVIEEENFLYSTQKANSLNIQNSFKPLRITPNNNVTSRPILMHRYQTPPSYSQNSFQNNLPPFQFTRPQTQNFSNPFYRNNSIASPNQQFARPFNQNYNQNRPSFNMSQNRPNFSFIQNRPNFNQNQNHTSPLFRQNNFAKTNEFKPEPMEISSGNSHIRNRNLATNHLYHQNFNNYDQSSYEQNSDFYDEINNPYITDHENYDLNNFENYDDYEFPHNDLSSNYTPPDIEPDMTQTLEQNFPKDLPNKEKT